VDKWWWFHPLINFVKRINLKEHKMQMILFVISLGHAEELLGLKENMDRFAEIIEIVRNKHSMN
jgi:hypothetical protein